MVTSVHLADVPRSEALRLLRRPPRPEDVPGLRYLEAVAAVPLSPRLLPAPRPGRVGLVAAWEDDASLDRFQARHPAATALAGGYRVRLKPVRIFGAWPQLGDLGIEQAGGERRAGGGPVAVLTLGRLRLRRAGAFLRASARAEADALSSPALMLATALARPPRLVATFSVWRDVAPMREYVERAAGGHRRATTLHAARPFHHQSAFIRFEPYDQAGAWEAPA